MSKTKPLTVEIAYRRTNQSNLLEIINTNFEKLNTNMKELYILGEFNINMYQNNEYIVFDDNTISSKVPFSQY